MSLEYGKGLTGYDKKRGSIPVFGTNGRIGWHSKPLCEHPGIVIGRKGAYRGVHFSDTPFWVIDTAFYVEPRADVNLRWAYYRLLGEDINSMDSGSAIPSTSRDDFYRLRFVLPPSDLQAAYAKVLEPAWARQKANTSESKCLADLRDSLLPQLVTGQIKINDAEAVVEEVVA